MCKTVDATGKPSPPTSPIGLPGTEHPNGNIPLPKPKASMDEVRKAIPVECFEKSLFWSLLYMVRDFAIVALLYYFRSPTPPPCLHEPLWILDTRPVEVSLPKRGYRTGVRRTRMRVRGLLEHLRSYGDSCRQPFLSAAVRGPLVQRNRIVSLIIPLLDVATVERKASVCQGLSGTLVKNLVNVK